MGRSNETAGDSPQPHDAATIAAGLGKSRREGRRFKACCPAHNDRNPSLSIEDGANGKVLVHCHAGCPKEAVFEALRCRGLWGGKTSTAEAPRYYTYVDKQGLPLHRTKRTPDKRFFQEHWTGKAWIDRLGSVTPVLYHFDEISERANETVHIAEGEKDVDALRDRGYLATTNPMGAGKWNNAYSETLRGRDVVLFYDNDSARNHFAGQKHAASVTLSLLSAGCRVRIAHLTDGCKDISDWFALGRRKPDLDALIETASYVDAADVTGWLNNVRKSGPVVVPIKDDPPLQKPGIDIDSIPSVHKFASQGIAWHVQGLFASGAVHAVTGESGSGKSTLMTYFAGCVSVGQECCGRECRQSPVLVIDRENPASVIEERLGRLKIQDGTALKFWGGWLPEEAPQPGASVIKEWVSGCESKPLIIVDSMIAFLDGDENDAAVMRAFMHQSRELANLGATVVVLHHNGKGESSRDYRGSSDFKASIDIGFTLANLGEGRLDRLRLKAFKSRFLVDSDLIITYRDGQFASDERPAAKTVTQQLHELLRAHPGIKKAEFLERARVLGLGRDRANDFLKNGIASGVVLETRGDKNARFHQLAGEGEF